MSTTWPYHLSVTPIKLYISRLYIIDKTDRSTAEHSEGKGRQKADEHAPRKTKLVVIRKRRDGYEISRDRKKMLHNPELSRVILWNIVNWKKTYNMFKTYINPPLSHWMADIWNSFEIYDCMSKISHGQGIHFCYIIPI